VSDTAAFRHEAMKLCRDCPVIAECLAGAIERREKFAVWGGRDFSHATTRPKLSPPPPKPIKHGTKGGYRMHYRRGVPMCEACRKAESREKVEERRERRSRAA
jgi:hypothetical protein